MAKKAQTGTINVLKWAIATVLFSMLMGCTTVLIPLTAEGKFVRQIPPEMISPCKFLVVVEEEESGSWTPVDNWRNVLNKIRNTVAKMGGNSYVLIQTTTSANYTNTQVEAYRCPQKTRQRYIEGDSKSN